MNIDKLKTSAFIIATVRAKGSDADDLRDAAHEACHALQTRLPGLWRRNRIHNALEQMCRRAEDGARLRRVIDRSRQLYNREMIRCEVIARAVEQLVCADLDYDCGGDVAEWAKLAVFETANVLGTALDIGEFVTAVNLALTEREARMLADQVIVLGVKSIDAHPGMGAP